MASGRGGASGRAGGGSSGAAWATLLSRLDGGGTRAGRGLVEGLRLVDGLRGTDWRELIANGSFDYAAPAADGADGAPRWSAWGRGARTRFDGTDGPLTVGGDVVTALVGADTRRGRFTFGATLSQSFGEGRYAGAGDGGTVESTLTSVNPYAAYAPNGRVSVWGTLGYGAGRSARFRWRCTRTRRCRQL